MLFFKFAKYDTKTSRAQKQRKLSIGIKPVQKYVDRE